MKVDKAIEILTGWSNNVTAFEDVDYKDALKLGIEALQRCQELRKYTPPDTYVPLPGETED